MTRKRAAVMLGTLALTLFVFLTCEPVAEADNPMPAEFAQALASTGALELYSIQPPLRSIQAITDGRILGSASCTGDTVEKIRKALDRGRREMRGPAKDCFEPRHALAFTWESAKVEVLICFACDQTLLMKNGKNWGGFRHTDHARALLDRILTDAKIPLAPR
jgi:hypothetical protein